MVPKAPSPRLASTFGGVPSPSSPALAPRCLGVGGPRSATSLSLSLNPTPSLGRAPRRCLHWPWRAGSVAQICLPHSKSERSEPKSDRDETRRDETGSGFPFGRFACIYNDLNLYIYSTLLLSLKLQNKDTSYKGRSIQVHSFFFHLSFAHGCSSIVLSLQTKTKKHIQQPTHACSSQRLSTLSTFRPYPCPPRGPP